jgi:hypothetical protein
MEEGLFGPHPRRFSHHGLVCESRGDLEVVRCGEEAQIVFDLPDGRQPLNYGDHLHRARAMRSVSS